MGMFTAVIQSCRVLRGPGALASFYNLIFVLLDSFVVYVLVLELYDDCDLVTSESDRTFSSSKPLDGTTFQQKHPVYLFCAVAAKWVNVMLTWLNISFLGKSVLPVWDAVKDRASWVFMLYLAIGCFGLTHAYYTFPMKGEEPLVESVWRVLRLFILGDFDLYEMEGVDQVIHGTSSGSHIDATIQDGEHRERLDDGLRVFIAGAVFLGPVLFLNVFIGVLGSAYEDAKAQINGNFMKFRLDHLMVLLLRDFFFSNLFCLRHCKQSENADNPEDWRDNRGVWIKLPADCLSAEGDVEFVALAKADQVENVIELLNGLSIKFQQLSAQVISNK